MRRLGRLAVERVVDRLTALDGMPVAKRATAAELAAMVDEPLPLGGFALCHHPRAVPGAYVLAGHWHPCVRVEGRALDRLRLPCFWFGEAVGVLPAFGEFTGMHPIRRTEGDRVYAVAEGQVVCLP